MAVQQEVLYTFAITAHKSPQAPSPGGKITIARLSTPPSDPSEKDPAPISSNPATSKPRPNYSAEPARPPIYLLTHHSPPDNRLTPPFLSTFLQALLTLEHSTHPRGILLTTSSIPKFYSNGLDLATFSPTDKANYLYPLWRKLLTYPMPTCAVINGHAFAGGLMTTMYHDYRIMNPHRGWLCLNELEFDAELAPGMGAVFKAKIPRAAYRGLLLEARRFTALQALEVGLVDGLGGVEDAVRIMTDIEGGHGRAGMVVGARGVKGVYGKLKEDVYRDILTELDRGETEDKKLLEGIYADRERRTANERALLEKLKTRKAKL